MGRLQEITPKNIPTSAGGDRWNLPQPVCPLRDPHREKTKCFVTGSRNRAFLVLAETDFRTASCPRIEVSQYSSSSPEGENEKSRRRIKRKVHEKREGSPRTHRPVKLRQPAFNAHGLRSPVGQCAGTSQRVPTALQGIGLTLMTQTFLRPAHGTPQLLCEPCPSPPREREREREKRERRGREGGETKGEKENEKGRKDRKKEREKAKGNETIR